MTRGEAHERSGPVKLSGLAKAAIFGFCYYYILYLYLNH
jgi:hypothetical protein